MRRKRPSKTKRKESRRKKHPERLICLTLKLLSSKNFKIKSMISPKVLTHSSNRLTLAKVFNLSFRRTSKTKKVLQLRRKRREAKPVMLRQRLKVSSRMSSRP